MRNTFIYAASIICFLLVGTMPLAADASDQESGSNDMQTFQEQLDFFNEHWPAMAAAAEENGSAGVAAFVDGFENDLHRRVLYMFARQGLGNDEWLVR